MVIITQSGWGWEGLFLLTALGCRPATQVVQFSQLRRAVQARFLLQVAQLIEFFHRGDEEVAGFVAVLRADDANFFKPDGEARYKAMTFAEISLEHSGAEFTFG